MDEVKTLKQQYREAKPLTKLLIWAAVGFALSGCEENAAFSCEGPCSFEESASATGGFF